MDFGEFEELEQFNIMVNKIEELHHNNNSSTDQGSEKKGLSIKKDGSYTRT